MSERCQSIRPGKGAAFRQNEHEQDRIIRHPLRHALDAEMTSALFGKGRSSPEWRRIPLTKPITSVMTMLIETSDVFSSSIAIKTL
jgi:hypothetical protein